MLTKKEITVIGDNFRLLDFDGDLKLSYSEALSLYHAVKSEVVLIFYCENYVFLIFLIFIFWEDCTQFHR
jgi:hypothetical protein